MPSLRTNSKYTDMQSCTIPSATAGYFLCLTPRPTTASPSITSAANIISPTVSLWNSNACGSPR